MSVDNWYVIDMNPEPWAVGPMGVVRKAGKLVPYMGRNTQLSTYQEGIKEALGVQDMVEGKIHLQFFFSRLRSSYTTPQARSHRKHEADTTNMQKALEDALQGVLYKNDKDVCDIRSVQIDQGEDTTPYIVIRLTSCPGFHDPGFPPTVQVLVDAILSRKEFVADDNVWRG